MKLFEVLIEGKQGQDHFFAMYHIHAPSFREVPGIMYDTARNNNFQLIRIEETNFLYNSDSTQAGVAGILHMSPVAA